jgi:hypothetical protein
MFGSTAQAWWCLLTVVCSKHWVEEARAFGRQQGVEVALDDGNPCALESSLDCSGSADKCPWSLLSPLSFQNNVSQLVTSVFQPENVSSIAEIMADWALPNAPKPPSSYFRYANAHAVPCTDDSDARMRFLGVGSAKAPFAGSDCGFKQYSKQEMRELLTGRHVVRDCSSTHCFGVSH